MLAGPEEIATPQLAQQPPYTILIAQQEDVSIMAGATDKAVIEDANEAALREFEEGVRRSIRQADAGLVKTFKTKEEFLDHLKNL
jgi:hypothetical protein